VYWHKELYAEDEKTHAIEGLVETIWRLELIKYYRIDYMWEPCVHIYISDEELP